MLCLSRKMGVLPRLGTSGAMHHGGVRSTATGDEPNHYLSCERQHVLRETQCPAQCQCAGEGQGRGSNTKSTHADIAHLQQVQSQLVELVSSTQEMKGHPGCKSKHLQAELSTTANQ
jgi:hypothetical protein